MDAESEVRRYYEGNTRRFLRYGAGSGASAIHRAVLHPDADDPFRFQESRVLKLLEEYGAESVIDLGCGVGSSLLWLESRRPARYLGITLSPLQARLAAGLTAGRDIEVRTGSYLDPASYDGLAPERGRRLFYGIESWLHCADPAALLRLVADRSSPGDILALWDDFPAPGGEGMPDRLKSRRRRTMDEFRRGWHALNTLTPAEADNLARRAGFRLIADEDYTPWLDIDRPRDRMIEAAVPLLKPLGLAAPWWQNLLGGNALRRSLKNGWIRYRFRAWMLGGIIET
jgi:SAM-dependent methyltransferase